MVCPELVKLGVDPLHIRKGGQIETQEAAEERLLKANGLGSMRHKHPFPHWRAATRWRMPTDSRPRDSLFG